MKILDKYILKKFLVTFVFVVFIFLAIILVIDIVEKMETFQKMKEPNKTEIIFFQYFLNFIPYIANMISPIMIFIATIFVTSQLSSRLEITAILASGTSFLRFFRPYFVGSIIIGIFVFYLTGWVIPKSNVQRLDFESRYIRGAFHYSERDVHIKIAPETYVYMQSYNNLNNIGYHFTLERIKGNQLLGKLYSEKIVWDTTKQKWHLENYALRAFGQLAEDSTFLEEEIKNGSGMDTTLSINPEDFQSKHLFNEKLTINELNDYIKLLKIRGSEDVKAYIIERYSRYASPFAILILTFLGVLVAFKRSRRGIGPKIAIGFVMAFVYILFFIVSTRALANSGRFPPLLAVWLPNIIFGLIGFGMYRVFVLNDNRVLKIIQPWKFFN